MQSSKSSARLVLLGGFGGLLLLMAFAGFSAAHDLTQIRANDDAIRVQFLKRNKLLNQIRSEVYLSGTYVRDYLLDPDQQRAERNRVSLATIRGSMRNALAEYRALGPVPEAPALSVLNDEIAKYWQMLEPVSSWGVAERGSHGYSFLRDEVFPRRTNMLNIADRIGMLNEEQLAQGALRVSRLYADFQNRLAFSLAATLGLGIALAAYSVHRILQLEREMSARYGELKQLSARLVEAQENERRAVSRELHDEVGQSLSALLVGLSNMSANLPESISPVLKEHFETTRRLAESSVKVVRNMALLLRPSMLDDFGLVAALEWQAREISRQSGIRVTVAAEGVSEDLPESHKTCVYRMVQEALHNCVRHAAARSVRIAIRQDATSLNLLIQDDGKGLDPVHHKGLGLLGMQERIANLGGTFRIESEPGQGTSISATLPASP